MPLSPSHVKKGLTGLLLSTSVALLLGVIPACAQDDQGQATKTQQVSDSSETYKELNLFGDVFERVRAQYVDQVDDKKLVEAAINGMLQSLDPHSSYMNEDEWADMQVQTKGEFGGLGIEVTQENGLIRVVSPIDDTPAFKAGVQPGDYITHIEGTAVIGMSLNDAVEKMRGKVGEPIKLTLRREGVQEPINLTLVRAVISIQSVKHDTLNDAVGYIRITTFNDNTDSGLKKAVDDIKAKLGPKLSGYIIDLRNNPGGLLEQAVAVSDDFLESGEIVSTRGRHEEDTKRENATPGDIADGLPIVVLINGGSASAAEIVSGALQDHRRAVLLGTQSFGKGSVQTIIPLPGNGAMRLTTARYYTPSGRSIQAKGITPDIMVEQSKVEELDSDRLHEADLPHSLPNPDQKAGSKPDAPQNETTKSQTDNSESKAAAPDVGPDGKKKTKEQLEEENFQRLRNSDKLDPKTDYQLSRAIDLLQGLSLYRKQQEANGNAAPAVSESATPVTPPPAARNKAPAKQ